MFSVQDEVAAAQPDIDKRVSQLVSKGRWAVPGYKVRRSISPLSGLIADTLCRKNLAISLCFSRTSCFHRIFCKYSPSSVLQKQLLTSTGPPVHHIQVMLALHGTNNGGAAFDPRLARPRTDCHGRTHYDTVLNRMAS